MSSSSLKREILGIALLLFAVFLAGAFIALALAQLHSGRGVDASVQASVGVVGTYLARPLVSFFGWPAAVLIPLVPAVHALRLFGRLASDTDRSWMIFFAGMVVLLPIALALALPAPPPGLPSLGAGMWGEFVAGVVDELVRRVRRVGRRCACGVRADGGDAGVESDSRADRPPRADRRGRAGRWRLRQ